MPDALRIELAESTVPVTGVVEGWIQVLQARPRNQRLVARLEAFGAHDLKQTWAETVVVEGPLTEGDAYAFAIQLSPHVPHSFQGQQRNVQWRVVARAGQRFAFDVSTSADLTVEPLVIDRDELDRHVEPDPESKTSLVEKARWAAVGLFNVAFGVAIAPVIAVAGAVYAAERHRERRYLRDFTVELRDRPYLHGEWVPVRLSFRVHRRVVVERLTLTLRAVETWMERNGSSETQSHEDQRVILGGDELVPTKRRRGGRGVYRGGGRAGRVKGPVFVCERSFQIPPMGPPSVTQHGIRVMRYEVVADATLRDATNLTAAAELTTRSIRIDPPPPAPGEPSLAETCGDVDIMPTA